MIYSKKKKNEWFISITDKVQLIYRESLFFLEVQVTASSPEKVAEATDSFLKAIEERNERHTEKVC